MIMYSQCFASIKKRIGYYLLLIIIRYTNIGTIVGGKMVLLYNGFRGTTEG